ncbi:hypothetical protein [Variovorax paradoxus]|uniref:hypothetical protein n=1 Tax=Variovorax paradoxus TaxID=34073 RepID=UPI0011866B58|nr:hypothetical protein [Variovorax paradoxus]
MLKNSVAQWLVHHRIYLFLALLAVAGLAAKYRSELEVVPLQALSARDVSLRYIGDLETVVSRSGIQHGSTRFKAGIGIGVENDIERNEMLRKLQPVLYVPFADVLDISRTQAQAVEGAGPNLRIMLHRGAIFAVSSQAGDVIPYTDYAEKAQLLRERWLWGTWAVVVIAVLYFAVATLLARHGSQVGR